MVMEVSSRLKYLEEHPEVPLRKEEASYEIKFLKDKVQSAATIAAVSFVAAVTFIAWSLGFGMAIGGALIAISLISATYAYLCNSAKDKIQKRVDAPQPPAYSMASAPALEESERSELEDRRPPPRVPELPRYEPVG